MRLAWLLVLALAPSTARADCAMWGLAPKVLTPESTVIAADGGIVVAAVPEARGKLDHGDAAVQASWKIRAGGDSLRPPIEVIAPGLAVYRVAVANAFKIELTDGSTTLVTVKPSRSRGDALAAPKVKSVAFLPRKLRHGAERVVVELAEPAPAGVVAMVLADAEGKPRSWGTVSGGATIDAYGAAECQALPNGTVASKAGDKVTLMFVDAAGRVSAATQPVAIAK
jgi:hypothetical protein